MQKSAFLFICLLVAIPCAAETIIVDPNGFEDFDNIQDAINYSWHGDTIIVRPATYNENIYFNGRAITLTSNDPNDPNTVSATIITAGTGYTVTFDFGEDSNSVLTGFTVTGYRGIYCYVSSPTISKNIIRNSTTDAGIECYAPSSPTISYNTITNNASYGIMNCGGTVKNNIITINGNFGLYYCYGIIKNNTIVNNSNGLYRCSNAQVINNIIAYNLWGIRYPCNNSYNVFWMNQNGNLTDGASAGTGDVVVDPLFVNYGGSDYHLKSGAGRWDPNTETWVIDDANSRCIDAGDPCDSVGIEPNPNGGRINMGAYGGTAEASKSPSGIVETVCAQRPAMDFDGDCIVDFRDFATFGQGWLDCNLDPPEACWQ